VIYLSAAARRQIKGGMVVDMCGQATRCDAMQYNSMTEVEAEKI
jgi:hypothetical protein